MIETIAGIGRAFLDATLGGKPGDLATLLRPYGDLTVHRPARKGDTGDRDGNAPVLRGLHAENKI